MTSPKPTKPIVTRTRDEVLKLWIAALRSGKYKQCRGTLRQWRADSFSYCCLGVLCDLAAKDGGAGWTSCGGYDNVAGGMPPEYMSAFLYPGQTGHIFDGMAGLNDSGAPFAVIAARLEQIG